MRRVPPARVVAALVLWIALPGLAPGAPARTAEPSAAASWTPAFEPNLGQFDAEVRFAARGPGFALFLTGTEAVMVVERAAGDEPATYAAGALPGRRAGRLSDALAGAADGHRGAAVTRLRWPGAETDPGVRGVRPVPGTVGYFVGDDPSRWRSSVPRFAAVEYRQLYPGIDLVFYFGAGGLEYDFVLRPGADPEAIRLEVEGADSLELDDEGNLLLELAGAEVAHLAPYVFQESGGERTPVAGQFVRRGEREVGFRLAAWDRGRPLVIDPRLKYSTYLGGSTNEQLASLALDATGNLYVATYTLSSDFPVAGADSVYQGGDSDLLIAKLNRRGKLVRAIYLGGNESEGLAPVVAVDPAAVLTAGGGAASAGAPGALFIAGHSFSKNFPLLNPIQGQLDCSVPFTPHPGDDCTEGKCCPGDMILTAFDLGLTQMLFSTFLGGNSVEAVGDMVIDDDGRVYLVGTTASKNFPTMRASQTRLKGGTDAAVVIIDPPAAGGPPALVFSTFLGGRGRSKIDFGQGIALDPAGYLQVAGETGSRGFPTVDPLQRKLAGKTDAFLAVYDLGDLTPALAARRSGTHAEGDPQLIFSSYFGGKKTDSVDGMALDGEGRIHLVGWTDSVDFPVLAPYQAELNGRSDAWVAVFDLDTGAVPPVALPELLFSTYFGGSDSDLGQAIAVDSRGTIHFGGSTFSADLPVQSPFQSRCAEERPGTFPLCQDAFVARFEQVVPGVSPRLLFSSFLGGPGVDNQDGTVSPGTEFGVEDIAVDSRGNTFVVGPTFSKEFPTVRPTQKSKAGGFDLFVAKITR